MKKDLGIITFHNGSNYGAALQTFALQEALKKYDVSVSIINYDNSFISKGLKLFNFNPSLKGFIQLLVDLIFIIPRKRKNRRFKEFFSKHYNLTKSFTYSELKNNASMHFDIGVSGSDQIWNPKLNGFDDTYFLEFPGIKTKVSYASSFGSYDFSNISFNQNIKDSLSKYRYISTRENAKISSKELNLNIVDVCDPTLLLNHQDWFNLLSLKDISEDYLLVYAMTDFENISKYAIKVGKQRGLKVIYLGVPVKPMIGIHYIIDAGPEEFVQLFHSAKYIVTNSFHGTAFSVNFCKQFVSLLNPKSPERAKCFLNSIGCENRLITDYSLVIDDMSHDDLKKMNDNLTSFVASSVAYIELFLSKKEGLDV